MSHSSQVPSEISSESGSDEQQLVNNQTTNYFQPKTYTVNDFHKLVEGINTQIKMDHHQIMQRISVLEKKQGPEKLSSSVLLDNYCAFCGWTSRSTEKTTVTWICWMASLIGVVVFFVAIIIAIMYLGRCCWKCAGWGASKHGHCTLKSQQQELLYA
uniref:LITAF domain-containing protein n=1 Tax=Ditylenchus dipsaci TaxID=166011 RepID=A0A915E776_9BILA